MNKRIIETNPYILQNNYNKIQLNINEFGYNHCPELINTIQNVISSELLYKYSSINESNENNLKNNIIKYFKNIINTNNIILSNSGDINILSILRLFNKSDLNITIFTPTYTQYANIAFLNNSNINKIPINFIKNITKNKIKNIIKNKLHNTNICFVCNPNNPTGAIWSIDALLYLFITYPNIIFVIDETYIDFSYLFNNKIKSVVPFINNYPNIIIMRSFSKAFGLAGLRLSYICSNINIIKNLYKIISQKDVIELSKLSGNIILNNLDFYKGQINIMFNEKYKLILYLKKSKIRFLNSYTNFICIYIGTNIKKIYKIFNLNNILVKTFPTGILKYYIRLNIQNNTSSIIINILDNNKRLIFK
jgi:histidinol-phosphate aminotransferase